MSDPYLGPAVQADLADSGAAGRSPPALSLILCSRNDDYQGAALWRLQTGLTLTAQAIHELGLEAAIEIILTDWGSEHLLQNALHLTPQAARLLTVLEVPPATARVYQQDAPFSEVHALNAAARRARGEYIGRIDQDTILGPGFLRTFFALYRGERVLDIPLDRALLLSNRRSIPYRFAAQRPPPWVVHQFIRRFGRWLPVANPLPDAEYYKSYVGIWLVHRDHWFAIGGYDESFIHMNWMEVDMILRLEPDCTFVNLGRLIDHDIYHLDHAHPLAHWGARGRLRRENPIRDREHPPPTRRPNGPHWGLASEDLRLVRYHLKPGAGTQATADAHGVRWGRFLLNTTLFGLRFALDQAVLGLIRLGMAGPRLALKAAPGLREPWAAYRDAVRGHALTAWPRLARDVWRSRRRRTAGVEPDGG